MTNVTDINKQQEKAKHPRYEPPVVSFIRKDMQSMKPDGKCGVSAGYVFCSGCRKN